MFNSELFANRLKSIRMQYQLTHSVLARYCSVFNVINLSQSTLSLWENNKRTPTVDNLQFVADIFAVNLDWLLGRSDEKYSESVIKILEPSSFPLTVTVCDTTVDVPIELPDDYKNYEIRQQTYSLAARADIIFLLYIIKYEWERYVGDRIYEFADKDESEIKIKAYQIFHYLLISGANKEFLEHCIKSLNVVFENKSPIFAE
ncbi:dNA-binding protein [Phascolarctobacterium sp. CAG:266]|nr:dNA-binding protein [Phascolarctobacterium sp. CAG:266]